MKFKNETDWDSKRLREIVAFAKPAGISKFLIEFQPQLKRKAGSFTGRAWTYSNSVLIRLPNPLDCVYPRRRDGWAGYLPFLALDAEEHAVYLVAHELRHLHQRKFTRGHRVWGAKGVGSERDASAYGIRKMREWRRSQ